MASLNPKELEVMKVLWDGGSLKPSEIQKRLPHPVKNSALRWQLGVLMEKGQVVRYREGKAYHYRAVTARRSAFKHLMHRMADLFCGGSAVALIGQMIASQEDLSEEEIRELQRIAASKAPSGGAIEKEGDKT